MMTKISRIYMFLSVVSICSALLGCAGDLPPSFSSPSRETGENDGGLKPSPSNPQDTLTGICSALSFNGFSWPSNMFFFEKESLQLALNISGSLEGPDGWQNLTNDFDGQGLSMGLMNQTLGTGSLQPLMILMRDRHPDKFRSLFIPAHFESLMGMLFRYQATRGLRMESDTNYSVLDIESRSEVAIRSTASSVEWARKNIYDSKNVFNSVWKKELLALAGSPEYASLQVDAAWALHTKALQLHEMLGIDELRTYLVMFDVVVQNGNLKEQDLTDYQNYVKLNPKATALQRLQTIIELRLRWVKPQYRDDVRRRKMSIVTGSGVVHSVNRAYEKEYCFNRLQAFSTHTLLP